MLSNMRFVHVTCTVKTCVCMHFKNICLFQLYQGSKKKVINLKVFLEVVIC